MRATEVAPLGTIELALQSIVDRIFESAIGAARRWCSACTTAALRAVDRHAVDLVTH
jgi:hypothetical protein